MRKFVLISVLPVAAFAVACGRGKSNDTTALNADLKRDLDAASAASVELASTSRDYQPARFVSAIESPATSAPVRRRNVRRPVARPTASVDQDLAKAPDPAPENKVEVAAPDVAQTEAPAQTIDTPTQVAVSPRPTPVGNAPASTDVGSGGVGGGSGGGGLGGIGEAIGTVIGVVVVRGGAGGVDHCDPRTDGRRGNNGPIYIPNSTGPTRAGGGIIINNPMPRGGRRW